MIELGGRTVSDLSIGYDCDVDRASGAATLRVPVPLPPGRNGFGPSLGLSYTSGRGNSAFGPGWALHGLPVIAIDTHERVPRWDGTDGYALSGDELVPWLAFDGTNWKPRGFVDGDWSVAFLRSRTGGAQVRVEKWVHRATGRIHFRTRDARNTVTIFGARPDGRTRVADPGDPSRTYIWLPELQLDAAGSAIWFEYEPETLDGVDRGAASERRRPALAQRYLKRVRYGNAQPVTLTGDVLAGVLPPGVRWCFLGVFDYGDHSDPTLPAPAADRAWPARRDPFSDCRAGFDIRTYRLCRRILSFHDFDELGPGPTLTGALVLTHDEQPAGSTLREVSFIGHRRDGTTRTSRALPPLRMTYAPPFVASAFVAAPAETQRNAPAGFASRRHAFVDLLGEGLPGILTESESAWFFKPNEGNGRFGEQALVLERPATRPGAWAFGDVDRDGDTDLSQMAGRLAGMYSLDRDRGRWDGFRPFDALPHVEGIHRAQWVDLNGDGRPDIVIPKGDRLAWFASEGDSFADPVEIALPARSIPTIAEDPMLDLFFADMNGDGLVDLVRVTNGRVEYWPSLGNGRFGDSVLFEGGPSFASDAEFDAGRLRFIDLDGTGTTDILYLGRGEVAIWRNASGNRLLEGPRLRGLPYFDNVSTVGVLDFLGDGRPCLVWSTPLPNETSLSYLPLAAVERAGLLLAVDDSLGQETRFTYSSSATHYLRDRRAGRPWTTRLPSHMAVVDRREVLDRIGGTRSAQRFEYRDGFYDGHEHQFRGFGRVDVYDTPGDASGPEPGVTPAQASLTRTWAHVGTATRQPPDGAYTGDASLPLLPPHVIDAPALTAEEIEDAQRALAGRVCRVETYAVDGNGAVAAHPFSVAQTSYRIVRAQPATKQAQAAFDVLPEETLEAVYEQAAGDPRVTQTLAVDVDAYGVPRRDAEVSYARRVGQPRDVAEQNDTTVLVHDHNLVHFDTNDRFELGVPVEGRTYELTGVAYTGRITRAALRDTAVTNALAAPKKHHETPGPGVTAMLLSWDRSLFWNDTQTAPLPFGQVGAIALVHHEESACFTPEFVTAAYGGRVGGPMLTAAGYFTRDGFLWQTDDTHVFGGASRFYQREALVTPGGARTSFEYDPYALEIVAQADALTNRVSGVVDYHALAAWRLTDVNGNVSEVRYDPLGVIVTTTATGHVEAQPWGFDALASVVPRTPPDLADVLARPEHYLQGASQFVWYDLDAWRRDGVPPVTVQLTREELKHDGRGGGTSTGRIQIGLAYLDGLGRTLQTKSLVDAGPAIQRDGGGAVIVDGGGKPILANAAERWRVSGHVVYDDKQQPRRTYEPYFSPSSRYESDAVLRQFGVATLVSYDAIGRETLRLHPNGTFSRTTYRPWSVDREDPNDTVLDSAYRAVREPRPVGDPERQALDHAKTHAKTATTVFLAPDGAECGTLERGGGTADDRRSESRRDAEGNVVAVVDPRGLTAFTHRYDMQGRAVHVHSIDAGDTWTFHDAGDRAVRTWDGRGFEVESGYDALDRPTTVHVRGNGLDHRVEERTYGGTDSAAAASNVRGALVRIRDQAGETSVARFDPAGQPVATTRRLRTGTGEADWRAAVPLDTTVFTTSFEYDALGRTRAATLPDGSTRTLTFLRDGGVQRHVVSTADGKVVNVPVLDGATFDAYGRRRTLKLGNGAALEFQYDAETARLTRQTATTAAGRKLQDAQYTYDPAGNLVRLFDGALSGPGAVVTGSTLPPRRDYTYDAHYRLTSATGRVHQALLQHDYIPAIGGALKGTRHITLNNGAALEAFTRTYEYDPSGNLKRIRHTGTTRSWTTDLWISASSNRSIPALDRLGVPVPSPESKFDAAGNLLALEHLRRIEWSWRSTLGRAVVIERPAGDVSDDEVYTYGADGLRVRKVTTRKNGGGVVEVIEKVYLGDCERKRITRGGVLILERWTSHFSVDDERIALLHRWTRDDLARETDDVSKARFRYQLSTHQGSSAIELDTNGDVISYEEYFPYGGSSFIAGDQVRDVEIKEYRYSGKECDDATGLYAYGYRYYAPWMGRWLSPDPIGPQDDLNLYQFVLGDPVGNVDPDGLQTSTTNLPVQGYVAKGLTEREAIRQFNASQGLSLGVKVTDLKPLGDGNWEIVNSRRLTAQELGAAHASKSPLARALTEGPSGETFRSLLDKPAVEWPEDFGKGTAGGETGGGKGGAEGGTGTADAPREQQGSDGTGTGTGRRGTGTGGGGTAARGEGRGKTGEGTSAGTGTGERQGSGTGTASEPGGSRGGTGTSGGGARKGGETGHGTRHGSGTGGGHGPRGHANTRGTPNGVQEGAQGGIAGGVAGGDVRGGTQGVPNGQVAGSANGVDNGTAPNDPNNNQQQQPGPPGMSSGTDPNGARDGSTTSSREGSRTGHPQGRAGGSKEGRAGGDSASGVAGAPNRAPERTLDRLTRYAGYANFEFSQGAAGGQRGGIPGATGKYNLGWFGQVAYIGLTVVTWVSPASIIKGVKIGGKLAIRGVAAITRTSAQSIGRLGLRKALKESAKLARKVGGSLIDNNTLSAILQGDAQALKFAERNAGRLFINTRIAKEALKKYTPEALAQVSERFGIRQLPTNVGRTRALMNSMGITAAKRFNDLSVVETARHYGLRLVSGDTGVITAALRSGYNKPGQLAARIFEHAQTARVAWYEKARHAVETYAKRINPFSITGSPR
ncbi:MAG TPA: SpvB/TcaC N-terminal domain-containing protein [Thermoanaerobaculia bacterium]